jgi:hypothetical protein
VAAAANACRHHERTGERTEDLQKHVRDEQRDIGLIPTSIGKAFRPAETVARLAIYATQERKKSPPLLP